MASEKKRRGPKSRGPLSRRPFYEIDWIIMKALAQGPMRKKEILKATDLHDVSTSLALARLRAKGYVHCEGFMKPYSLTAKGKKALRMRLEAEKILRGEVMPALKRAVDLGLRADVIVQTIVRAIMKAGG